ncbi:restriction modification system DNA specificity domain-containing protein [Methanocaldococcus villosus KIN24-T80]|uniref:Restriction modification system DNA specificity domain-containing protein n=1 Tax=Methanocaldococcus villosus KIN24-T80 TaxID=1069083 RepID=N6UV50_9EURY|nr:restriction endonuclease subunit S [Methanocaldococcus villosus]ENN96239.1 restriction modification system DNA specificity domain-containing protein [Methanocaldococcus villosus KIN24-T80]
MVKFRWETEFKETEIGKIPKDWEVKRLGEIANISTGGTPSRKKKEYWNGKINWLKSKEVQDNYIYDTEEKITEKGMKNSNAKRLYPPGTLILAIYASPTAGRVAILKIPSTINQALAAIEGNNNKFLFFSLIGNRERLLLRASGAAQQNLNLEIVKNFEIPYPQPEEQTRISTVLSWFDDLIENKKKQNEILEKMAMAIFKSWFIDFEPFQDEEFVYNEELDMEIPKGWEVKPIGEVADATSGFSYKSSEKLESSEPESYVFITLNNTVEGGGFKPVYSWVKSERIKKKHLIKEGDLILPNTEQTKDARLLGSPGIVVFPPDYNKNYGVYSMDIVKVTPIKDHYKYYLYFNFRFNREEIATFHSGTNILHFKIQNFKKNYYLLIPPEPILQRFHSLVEPLFKKIILNQKQILTLKKIRDTLLPQLVFGRLRIEEI